MDLFSKVSSTYNLETTNNSYSQIWRSRIIRISLRERAVQFKTLTYDADGYVMCSDCETCIHCGMKTCLKAKEKHEKEKWPRESVKTILGLFLI